MRNFVIFAVSISTLFILTGCGSAWVIRETADGGTIGYRGYRSSDSATEAIQKLIPCSSFSRVSDEMHSQDYQYTAVVPVTTTSNTNGSIYGNDGSMYRMNAQTQQTNYVPQTYSGTNSWREFTYRCDRSNSYNTSTESVRQPASCQDECFRMDQAHELKRGMSVESCMHEMCSK